VTCKYHENDIGVSARDISLDIHVRVDIPEGRNREERMIENKRTGGEIFIERSLKALPVDRRRRSSFTKRIGILVVESECN
jgi:hypothetical protein